jgi:uncharacterized membrane protein
VVSSTAHLPAFFGPGKEIAPMQIFGRILIVLAMFTLAVTGCDSANQDTNPAEKIDEAAITSVWQKARLRGVSFRAIGQEPGWLLEIATGTEILLVLDYGQSRTSYAYVEPEDSPELRQTRYRIGGLVILIEEKHCQDTMSGEEFAATVTISINDRRLSGCGRALH